MRHVAREQAQFFQDNFEEFLLEAEGIAKRQAKKDALETMAKIVDTAADIFNGDLDQMMRALGMVFLGLPSEGPFYGPGTLDKAHKIAEGYKDQSLPDYYLGDYFKNDRGFGEIYRDGSENQVYHLWGYIAQTTVLSNNINLITGALDEARLANVGHEFFPDGNQGGSREDFALGVAGMYIGRQITFGEISPFDLGNVLRVDMAIPRSILQGIRLNIGCCRRHNDTYEKDCFVCIFRSSRYLQLVCHPACYILPVQIDCTQR